MKVLFITSSRIGDAVLSTGLLAHLVETHPAAEFTVACGPLAAPLFRGVPRLERVISLEKRSFERHWIALWRMVVPHHWDLVVDLRNSAVSRLIRARRRAILRRSGRDMHKVEELALTLDLARAPAPHLWLTTAEDALAADLIPDGGQVLALAPAANWRGKQWRAERFAELALRLTGPEGPFPSARVAVLAAPAERAQAQPVLDAVGPDRSIDLVGRTDPLQAAACIGRCTLFVGNDSGLMHIASAMGVPTLALFGPGFPEIYGPWGPLTAVVRTPVAREILTGAPNYDHRTTDTLMDSLTVDAVEAAVRDFCATQAVTQLQKTRV